MTKNYQDTPARHRQLADDLGQLLAHEWFARRTVHSTDRPRLETDANVSTSASTASGSDTHDVTL